MRKALIAKIAALAVVVGVVGIDVSRHGTPPLAPPSPAPTPTTSQSPKVLRATPVAALRPFTACDTLLDHVRTEATRIVGAYGLPGTYGGMGFGGVGGDVVMSRAAGVTAGVAQMEAAAPVPAAADSSFSGTNVQEEGVDEPDIVKTDGRWVFAIAGDRLRAVGVSSGAPRRAGSLALPGDGHEILLVGDRVLVLASAWGGPGVPRAWQSRQQATVSVVDVSNPSAMKLLATLRLEGEIVSARLAGGLARVVMRSSPSVPGLEPPQIPGARAERAATSRNRRAVGRAALSDWLPDYRLETRKRGGTRVSEGRLTSCNRVSHPAEFSGLSTVTVVTVDPRDPRPRESVAVLGDANIVYASPKSLYVATNRWNDIATPMPTARLSAPRPRDVTTQIHKFDISGTGPATYLASGEIKGYVLNQWSMSELDGNLRVAATSGQPWGSEKSESSIVVLAQQEKALVRIGRVRGLGKGERIYAVRFIGTLGYVVTFRQIDPLYVIDLSNPRRPAIKGQVKIPGYSAYLHPIGDGLLLGVGQDADENGRARGTQVSIFDVSDPAAPVRLHTRRLGDGHSDVEFNHHAFLYWPATGLTVIPVERYSPQDAEGADGWWTGAVGLHAARSGIREVGRLSHIDRVENEQGRWRARITRSLVVGDAIYTMSEAGLLAADLHTLADRSWLPWT